MLPDWTGFPPVGLLLNMLGWLQVVHIFGNITKVLGCFSHLLIKCHWEMILVNCKCPKYCLSNIHGGAVSSVKSFAVSVGSGAGQSMQTFLEAGAQAQKRTSIAKFISKI
ncbi:hypothetical protein XENOCAPTIV_029351 [Xenoophorus captivus]|uniref:Uncharacterized protein n=1 Tax=Xenoophorus captivus TaxID=1517983 RepID=A0ABV0R5F4_9TELE